MGSKKDRPLDKILPDIIPGEDLSIIKREWELLGGSIYEKKEKGQVLSFASDSTTGSSDTYPLVTTVGDRTGSTTVAGGYWPYTYVHVVVQIEFEMRSRPIASYKRCEDGWKKQ
jgi:hypothetical protein